MTDEGWFDEWIDERLGRIASAIGLSEDTPPQDLTRELGYRFGAKLRELLPLDQEVYDYLALSALQNLAEVFPPDPDEDIQTFQAILFGPMVSVALTGRGLSVPELASMAGLNPAQLYRVLRKGMNLFYKPADPKPRTGIHRDQSGIDHRKARMTVDYDNMLTKEWPAPLGDIQPFLLGIVEGAKSCLEDTWVRIQVECGFKAAMAKALRDPILGDIFDGGVQAAQRVIQSMADNGLLLSQVERGRAHAAGLLLVELSGHKGELLDALSSAATEIETTPDRAGRPALASGSAGQ